MILMISISANLIADPNTAAVGAAVNVVLGLFVASVSLYLPLRGIHLRIVDAKMQVLLAESVFIFSLVWAPGLGPP